MAISLEQWKRAQEYEKEYWKNRDFNRNIKKYKTIIYLNQKFDIIKNTVLNIGGGPTPVEGSTNIDPLCSHNKRSGLDKYNKAKYNITAMGEAIPISPNSFDLVVCSNSLDHMMSPEHALSEMHRVLKQEGTLCFRVSVFDKTLIPIILTKSRVGHFKGHPHIFHPTDLLRMIKKAGFIIENKILNLFDILGA